jgi:hypothetical protein
LLVNLKVVELGTGTHPKVRSETFPILEFQLG